MSMEVLLLTILKPLVVYIFTQVLESVASHRG